MNMINNNKISMKISPDCVNEFKERFRGYMVVAESGYTKFLWFKKRYFIKAVNIDSNVINLIEGDIFTLELDNNL